MPYHHAARTPHGYAFHYNDQGGLVEGDTIQCIHCQGHRYVSEWRAKGSPMCRRCMGPLCGDGECLTVCRHWEQELLTIERNARRIAGV